MPRAESPDAEDALKQQEMHSIQDFELPKTLVTRIAKGALPDNIKLQKEAVTALVMSSTVFINYLAATAQDVTWSRSAKTITAQDVLKALEIIEFDDQVEPMKRELAAWRSAQDPKSKGKKRASTGGDAEVVENPYAKPKGKRKSKAAEPDEEEKGEEDEEHEEHDAGDAEGEGEEGEGEEGAEGEEGEGEEGEEGDEDEEMEEDEPPEEDVNMEVEGKGLQEDDEEEE